MIMHEPRRARETGHTHARADPVRLVGFGVLEVELEILRQGFGRARGGT